MRVERGIVGSVLERGAEEGIGFGILLAHDEQVRQAGVRGEECGILLEYPAIGGFGGVVLAGLFSQLGGKESVFGSFGREFQGLKEIIRGGNGVLGAIDTGQGPPGASFEFRTGLAGIKCGRGGKFRAGFTQLVLAGKEQAQRKVGLKGFGIGCDGAAVECGRIVRPILRVGNVSGIEECARVGGMGG